MLCGKLDTGRRVAWIESGIMEDVIKYTKSFHKPQVTVFYTLPCMFGARKPLHKSGLSVFWMAGTFNLFNF